MKKIAIIGTVGLPAKYGGWETLVEYITRDLNNEFYITVFCSSKRYDKKISSHNGVRLLYVNLDANGVQSIFYDLISMAKAVRFADTLLVLGVSGCVFLPIIRLFSKKKIIVNIDGIEWKRAKWGRIAKRFLKISEALAVRYSDVVVADNKAIQTYVEREYGKQSKLIAYGGDHVRHIQIQADTYNKYPFLKRKYAFKVCRIEPENNIHIILEAFKDYAALDIVVVGNWGNSEYGKKLKREYFSCENIHMLDPIYDQNQLNQLRSNCYIYIHGHSAGGTNPSLVEAMYLGLPVIAFSIIYNIETTFGKALYFKDKDELIMQLKTIDEERANKIGMELRCIAKDKYLWSKVASSYAEIF